jgi:hypothetical protein
MLASGPCFTANVPWLEHAHRGDTRAVALASTHNPRPREIILSG